MNHRKKVFTWLKKFTSSLLKNPIYCVAPGSPSVSVRTSTLPSVAWSRLVYRLFQQTANVLFLFSVFVCFAEGSQEDMKKSMALNESAIEKVKYNNLNGAEEDLLQALAYSEENASVRRNLSVVYYKKGSHALGNPKEYLEAQRYFKKAIEIDPSNLGYRKAYASSLFEEAKARERAGSSDEAMALYLKAADADEKNPHLWIQAGHFAWKIQRLKDALYCLSRAKVLDANNKNVKILEEKINGSSSEESYVTESSEHFILAIEKGQTLVKEKDSIVQELEQVFNAVTYRLGVSPKNKISVLFYPIKEFRDRWKLPARVVGHFDGKLRIPYASNQILIKKLAPVIRHELTHAFIHQLTNAKIPHWLNEGLAQWVEDKKIDEKSRDALVIYEITRRIPDLSHLDAVIQTQNNPYNGSEMTLAYMKSLTVVQYLIEKNGILSVMNFIKEYGQLSEETLFLRHFHATKKQVEAGWIKWIESTKI